MIQLGWFWSAQTGKNSFICEIQELKQKGEYLGSLSAQIDAKTKECHQMTEVIRDGQTQLFKMARNLEDVSAIRKVLFAALAISKM